MNSAVNGKSDEDCLFLERVLDKLYDFGTKKKKKRKRGPEQQEDPLESQNDSVSFTAQHQSEQTDRLPQKDQVEVVTFQDPRKNNKTSRFPVTPKTKSLKTTEKNSEKTEELSLEKARLEVHRFGITGYKKEQQRVFEQDRAVMLGARPPKKQCVNYKVLQQQIKDKKQKEKEEVDPDLKTKKKKKSPKDRRKSSTSGSGAGPSGQVGRFKNGMLILSPKEFQKIKGSKGKK
ncbi:unnamed protein product [Knipowitschia caucasica]